MKVNYHRLEVFVLDFECYGIESVINELDNNRHFNFKVMDEQSTVIPEWTDDHEVNRKASIETCRKYFDAVQVGKLVDIPLRNSTELEEENRKLISENEMLKLKLKNINAASTIK